MAFLEIENNEFNDIQEFIEFLEYDKKGHQLPSNLQVVATISTLKTIEDYINDLIKYGFFIEKGYGKLILISKAILNKKIYYYTFFNDRNNVHLFLTIARKTDDIPAEYRPEIERGIQYRGDDGRLALDEMEFYYGVMPKILEIRLPNGVAFRIDNKGIITLFKGSFGDFSARVIDNNNSSSFDIATTGKRMDIYPIEQTEIGSYIRFYEFLVETVDPLAVVG